MNATLDLSCDQNPASSTDPAVRMSGGYRQDQLEAAFALVQPTENWKSAISAVIQDVERKRVPALKALIRAAVIHFTGSVPTTDSMTGSRPGETDHLLVMAAGYYAAIGA
jgi:hypothetical protein